MNADVFSEFRQQLHELSSDVEKIKASYVRDFSNLLSKLESLEAANRYSESLLEHMRCQLASHCENENNLIHELRSSGECTIFLNFYDVTEKFRRMTRGETLVSLGASEKFYLFSHEFRVYAEIGRRNGATNKVRLFFKEFRPTTSPNKLSWPLELLLEVNVCNVTRHISLECSMPPNELGRQVRDFDMLSLHELFGYHTVKEQDYFCISITARKM